MSNDREIVGAFFDRIKSFRSEHADPSKDGGWFTPELRGHETECRRKPDPGESYEPERVIREKWLQARDEAMRGLEEVRDILIGLRGQTETDIWLNVIHHNLNRLQIATQELAMYAWRQKNEKNLPSDQHSLARESSRHDHFVAELRRAYNDGDFYSALDAIRQAAGGKCGLPVLQRHDLQAWQISMLQGMTQAEVAEALNQEHGTRYTQGQVSRMISRAKAHADANGLTDKLPKPAEPPRIVDPGRLEIGPRVDRRKPRPSDLERADEGRE